MVFNLQFIYGMKTLPQKPNGIQMEVWKRIKSLQRGKPFAEFTFKEIADYIDTSKSAVQRAIEYLSRRHEEGLPYGVNVIKIGKARGRTVYEKTKIAAL